MQIMFYLLTAIFISLAIRIADAIIGIILAHFPRTRWVGLSLWASSGFFLTQIPNVCPADRCSHCRNWTCPRFHEAVRKNVD